MNGQCSSRVTSDTGMKLTVSQPRWQPITTACQSHTTHVKLTVRQPRWRPITTACHSIVKHLASNSVKSLMRLKQKYYKVTFTQAKHISHINISFVDLWRSSGPTSSFRHQTGSETAATWTEMRGATNWATSRRAYLLKLKPEVSPDEGRFVIRWHVLRWWSGVLLRPKTLVFGW